MLLMLFVSCNSPLCYFIHFIFTPRFSLFFRRLKTIDFLLIGTTPPSLGVGLNEGAGIRWQHLALCLPPRPHLSLLGKQQPKRFMLTMCIRRTTVCINDHSQACGEKKIVSKRWKEYHRKQRKESRVLCSLLPLISSRGSNTCLSLTAKLKFWLWANWLHDNGSMSEAFCG